MRAVVTGSNGFLGRAFARAFRQRGADVGWTTLRADLSRPGSWEDAI